mmetsp:Transcript_26876/g.61885  ORF Transcript_26876/g.61885 Transcript_26876/m.61885 type:complete len:101 (-) Transcript_26876:441-743(-)
MLEKKETPICQTPCKNERPLPPEDALRTEVAVITTMMFHKNSDQGLEEVVIEQDGRKGGGGGRVDILPSLEEDWVRRACLWEMRLQIIVRTTSCQSSLLL